MGFEGLVEIFEGNFADTCAEKFQLVLMQEEPTRQACTDGERGPPSVLAEIGPSGLRALSRIKVSTIKGIFWSEQLVCAVTELSVHY